MVVIVTGDDTHGVDCDRYRDVMDMRHVMMLIAINTMALIVLKADDSVDIDEDLS